MYNEGGEEEQPHRATIKQSKTLDKKLISVSQIKSQKLDQQKKLLKGATKIIKDEEDENKASKMMLHTRKVRDHVKQFEK